MGLIFFYREHRSRLIVGHLSKMCRLTSDSQEVNIGWIFQHITLPRIGLARFFLKNDWDLPERWERLKELLYFSHLEEDEILKILNFSDTKSLQDELYHINQYVLEEKLFKVGRFHAALLKKSRKARVETNQKNEALKTLVEEKNTLQVDKEAIQMENKALQDHLLEKEETILNVDARKEIISLKAVEEFMKSSAYHRDIHKCIQ
ncbi:hypothetical protein IEQ34_017235 [Dendrobium chrysotoxum]|uniref:Uncharacterized protein n=1 Tax=Dendrobium chrysotoxum TaxID=161865 RepID=A0AAV7G8Z5_DENCH|nr:hypothetical protein IEQ34_017235 [Dendrobium chrysotoxum]